MAHPVTDAMKRTIKRRVLPVLRARGFKGAFPTLVRSREGKTDRINFQFSQWGGGFYVNVDGLLRLGAHPPHVDHLFRLPDSLTPEVEAVCERHATDVISLLDEQGERWWREGPAEYPELRAVLVGKRAE